MDLKDKKVWGFYLTAILLVVADQLTKLIVKGCDFGFLSFPGMNYGESIPVLGSFLQFTYIENAGMAFGITFGAGKIFLSLFSVFASAFLAYYIYKIRDVHFAVKLGFSLILAGAFGNLIDRVFYGVIFGEQPLFYGHVVDFIQVDIPDIDFLGLHYSHWPVFNIADSCVSCGVVLLLLVHNKIPLLNDTFKKSNSNTSPEKDSVEKNDE